MSISSDNGLVPYRPLSEHLRSLLMNLCITRLWWVDVEQPSLVTPQFYSVLLWTQGNDDVPVYDRNCYICLLHQLKSIVHPMKYSHASPSLVFYCDLMTVDYTHTYVGITSLAPGQIYIPFKCNWSNHDNMGTWIAWNHKNTKHNKIKSMIHGIYCTDIPLPSGAPFTNMV